MAITQLEQVFNFALCAILVISGLQLLAVIEAKSLPARDVHHNATNQTECQCNGTNLTMMVDGHFLYKWRVVNGRHTISNLTKAAGSLRDATVGLQTKDCYSDYKNNFNLTYISQPVTHALLRQFYNAFVLHRRFVAERLLKFPYYNKPLKEIYKELDKNIARLYHVLNITGCDCMPNDCEQIAIAFQSLTLSTEHCFEDNLPINDVAKKIYDDATALVNVIDKLRKGNPKNNTVEDCSFHYKNIEHSVKVKNQTEDGVSVGKQWCYY